MKAGGEYFKTTNEMMQEIDRLITEYEKKILNASKNGFLADNTVKTYLLHSCNFVKWCHG